MYHDYNIVYNKYDLVYAIVFLIFHLSMPFSWR